MTAPSDCVWVVAGVDTAVRWAEALTQAGIAAEEHPWCVVRAPEDTTAAARALAQEDHDLVLFTSPHAPEALPPGSGAGRPCVCVGRRTADAARQRGFEIEIVGSAGAEALSEQVLSDLPAVKRVLFLRGREAREVGPARLRAAGLLVQEVVAYEMAPHPDFERTAASVRGLSVVVVGSPRAVAALARLPDGLPPDVRLVAPGESTGDAAGKLWPDRVHLAERPDPEMIVQAVRAAMDERRRTAS